MNIVGHRGVGGCAPENTLSSFKRAISLGCQRTELDVHLSKDNQLVVIHDETVDRVSDGRGVVREMNLSELRKLNLPEGQKIPTLQEVIDICKGKIDIQIELKGEGTATSTAELIMKNDIIKNTLVTSFDIDFLREIKRVNNSVKIGLLLRKDLGEMLWNLAEELHLDYICPKFLIVTREMVNAARKRNLKVYAYAVNDKASWQKMFDLGVDDIGTDFPDLFGDPQASN